MSQNEFIWLLANAPRLAIIEELNESKCFSLVVDASPDCSHVEQSTFIVRYLTQQIDGSFVIIERFSLSVFHYITYVK